MRETQIYPERFGKKVAKLHLKQMAMHLDGLDGESMVWNLLITVDLIQEKPSRYEYLASIKAYAKQAQVS